MKKIFALCLPVILLLAGCQSQTQDAPTPSSIPDTPVETISVGIGFIKNEIVYSGQVTAEDEVAVMPASSGKVERVFFDVGDRVSKGAVLFTMDKKTIQDNIKTLNAQLNSAESAVKSAQTMVDNVTGGAWQNQILQAKAAVDKSLLALDEAKRALETATTMYELDEISYEQLHQSETAVQNAQLTYDQAVSAFDIASSRVTEDNLQSAQNALDQAQAQVNTVRVQIQNAQGMLADASVKAPISGIISSRTVQEGGMAGMSSPAFTIVNIDTVEVIIKVTEFVINKLSPGQEIALNITSAGSEPFLGVISLIPPSADQTKGFPIRIKIPNEDHILKAGMFATAAFVIDSRENVVLIPRGALMEDEQGGYVYVAEGNTAKKIRVTTGLDDGNNVEIVSGLTEGQALIVKGQTYLTDGAKITVENTDAAAEVDKS